MSKIRDLSQVIKAGARNNKYRISIPTFGKELDVLCHSIDSPGVSIGISDVYLKGRKYQIAGNRSDAGTFTMSFYNEQDLRTRMIFLDLITSLENYEVGGSMRNGIGGAPFYQGKIKIEQLGHEQQVTRTIELSNSFVSEVSNIEYTDEVGEVTSTTVTFAYTGIRVN